MPPRTYLYAGCYTHESPVGIRVYDASDPDGAITETSQVEGIDNPSFLAIHPSGRVLYAVSETLDFNGFDGGGLVGFAIDPDDGSLANFDQVSSKGTAPCYVSVDADGRHLYVANYLSGSIAVYALRTDDRFGELLAAYQHHGSGPSPRQQGPHAHCILPGPGGDFLYAVDLGTDRIMRYARGRGPQEPSFICQDELAVEPGSGPRHLAFHPQQPVAFLVCELDSTIVTLGLEPATGRLSRRDRRSTLPGSFAGESTAAELRVHPNGRYVYVSNRGHDSIAVFRFTSIHEAIEPLGHVHCGGKTPRNFAVHPSGRSLLVANQDSDTITPFRIDPQSGVPERLDESYELSQPVCLTFLEVAR